LAFAPTFAPTFALPFAPTSFRVLRCCRFDGQWGCEQGWFWKGIHHEQEAICAFVSSASSST
jgi:hypothetical protein